MLFQYAGICSGQKAVALQHRLTSERPRSRESVGGLSLRVNEKLGSVPEPARCALAFAHLQRFVHLCFQHRLQRRLHNCLQQILMLR